MIKANPTAWQNERGVILPILAVMFLSLLTMVVFIGIEPHLIRNRRAEILQRLDIICQDTVQEAYNPQLAADLFGQRISELEVEGLFEGMTLLNARLLMPTMPEFQPLVQPSCGSVTCSVIEDISSGAPASGDLNFPYAFPEHFFETGNPRVSINPNFVVNQNAKAGTLAVCDLSADWQPNGIFKSLRSVFSKALSEPNIRLRVAYSNPVSNWYSYDMNSTPPYERSDNLESANSLPIPNWDSYYDKIYTRGLSIVIAPHMTTPSNGWVDSRFSFDSVGFYPNEYRPEKSKPTAYENPHPNTGIAQIQHAMYSGILAPLEVLPPLSGPADDKVSESAQMMMACANPAIMVRNYFISTIHELAARHGQLRSRTGVYIAGTQHRLLVPSDSAGAMDLVPDPLVVAGAYPVLNNPPSSSSDFLPRFPNPPVALLDMGQDLTGNVTQHPFVFFYNGAFLDSAGSSNTNFRDPLSDGTGNWPTLGVTAATKGNAGYIVPLVASADAGPNAGAGDSSITPWRALIANQLRICATLYGGSGATLLDYDTSQLFFQPQSSGDVAYARTANLPIASFVNGSWAHECNSPTGDAPPGNLTVSRTCPNPQGMKVADAVRTLGSIQICPISRPGLLSPFFPNDGSGSGACNKNPVYDLKPDLIGSMLYLDPLTSNFIASWPATDSPDGVSSTMRFNNSIPFASPLSPGYFPISNTFVVSDSASIPSSATQAARRLLPFPTPNAYAMPAPNATLPRPNLDGAQPNPPFLSPSPNVGRDISSILLMVTHKAINAAERDLLAHKVFEYNYPINSGATTLRRAPRPVILVFIPTNDNDANSAAFFRQALGLTTDAPWGVGFNTFVDLNPRASLFADTGSYSNGDPNQDFGLFWLDLLTEGGNIGTGRMNIVDYARNVFDNHIVKMDRHW